MRKIIGLITVIIFILSCSDHEISTDILFDNPEIELPIPEGFPSYNSFLQQNRPTKYGVQLGEKLFNEKKFSANNSISCASCHQQSSAFADNNKQAIGIYNRIGLRNTPAIQNMAFMKFYNWDGHLLQLERQPLLPIITHEEMNSSIVEVIGKIKNESTYRDLFRKTFGDDSMTPDRIYKSIAQYEYTLISANSKYDRVRKGLGEHFTESETNGYRSFQQKCESCHSTELFTDQQFRNVGFPLNPNSNEAGRARVTGIPADYMSFRVPSLRNVAYTAPYGSFGQFATLKSLLDYFDNGVLETVNLDPILKEQGNRIPLTEQEKYDLIAFLNTLSDPDFVRK